MCEVFGESLANRVRISRAVVILVKISPDGTRVANGDET